MIEAVELSKTFGDFRAVKGISLEVGAGEILALLGHNGAGKTTTIRLLSSILAPTSGYARIAGYDTVKEALDVRRVIGHLTELPGLYNRMRIEEYLDFYGELQFVPKKLRRERIDQTLHRFDLWETRRLRIGEYSKGMRQKTALIRALLHEPQVLFLDEPTSAMDPHSAKMVRDAIGELKETNRAIILCTHNLFEAEKLADKIAIIRKGEIVIQGTVDELKRELLGISHYEARFARPLTDTIPSELFNLVDIIETREEGLIFATEEAAFTNPKVLNLLAGAGAEVITLSEVPRSLEAAYLKIAGQPQDEVEQSRQKPDAKVAVASVLEQVEKENESSLVN